ncbi:MAG TPA: TonB-dependent receptor, partial [Ideonella sp.]|nr:TonB-dependent receptor [Ideonella sp.]
MIRPLPARTPLPFAPRNEVAALFIGAALLASPSAAFAQATPAAAAAPTAAAASAAEPTNEGQIERITITAEKRLTVLDTTPAAITALNGSKLAETGLTTFSDVVTQVPNTSFTTGQGASQLFIRGIGNVFILAGGDPGVALYADGAYVSDQTSSNVSLFDLQRVEVLRGPQGALYGRNATGGAMNLISAPPTATFKASAGVLLGSYNRKESEGYISGPLFGEGGTRLRFSYQVKSSDGYTDNPLSGTTNPPVISGPSTTGPDHLDDLSSRAFRLQSLTDIGAGTLHLQASHYHERDAGPSMPLLVDPVMIPGLLFGVTPSTDPRVVKSQGASNLVEVNSLLAGWEQPVGDATLSVTASLRKSHANRLWDSDTTEALVATSGFKTRSEDTSIDAHLAGESGALTWLVGATALSFTQKQDIDIQTMTPLGFIIPGQPLNIPGPVEFLLGGEVRTESAALYTDLRYAFSPQWSLLAGLRLSHDHKAADEYQHIVPFTPPLTGSPQAGDWTSVPGSLGLEYQIDKGMMAYGRYAHGFKSGAVNLGSLQPEMVKPENVDSVEFGFKTDFWERRGAFSVAAFSSRYKDMQVSQVGQATVILANASKARIDGLEVELQLRPIPSLTLGLSFGLMDPRYSDFENADLRNMTPLENVKGNQLAFVSKANAALSAEYSTTV